MSIVVYYGGFNSPQADRFEDAQFMDAVKLMEQLRRDGFEHVIMSNAPENSVGKPGVDSVVDGKLPDGTDYTWKKRRL